MVVKKGMQKPTREENDVGVRSVCARAHISVEEGFIKGVKICLCLEAFLRLRLNGVKMIHGTLIGDIYLILDTKKSDNKGGFKDKYDDFNIEIFEKVDKKGIMRYNFLFTKIGGKSDLKFLIL